MKMKNEFTTQHTADFAKKQFDIFIERSYIGKFWKGQIELPDVVTHCIEYQFMISLETVKLTIKKFTAEELQWVRNNESGTLTLCAEEFKEQFGKDITLAYICKLKK
jgi:hypothetical protein